MKKKLPNGWIFIPFSGITNLNVKSLHEIYKNDKYDVSIIETLSNHRNNPSKVIRRSIRLNIESVDTIDKIEFEIPKNIPLDILLENYDNLLRKVYYKGFIDKILNKN